MRRFVLRRTLASLVVILLVSVIAFCIMLLIPGDPAAVMAGVGASPDQIETLRRQLGLDRPLPVQVWTWLANLARGDLGWSITLGRPVTAAVAERLPVTLSLAGLAFVWTLLFGLGAGVLSALRPGSWIDRAAMALAVFGVSLPSFWLALMMIVLFGVKLEWFPVGGYVPFSQVPIDWLRSLVLPSIALALLQIGLLARITRGAMLEVTRQDFVRTARAKGVPPGPLIVKHVLLNAAVPIATIVGTIFSLLLSGAVVIETVFSIPGIGRLMANAVTTRDYPVIQGALIVTAAMFVVINLIVDLAYGWLDPRIRQG